MEEIELMDIAEKIIPILRAKNLTYNQAKEVLECCEFLLGDECRMSCEGMRLLQFLKRKKLQSKCRRLIRKNFCKDEIIRPKKRRFAFSRNLKNTVSASFLEIQKQYSTGEGASQSQQHKRR